MESPKLEDCGRQVVVDLHEGGNLVADLLVIDARPDSLEFGIRDGSAIRRLSDFTGWRFAK